MGRRLSLSVGHHGLLGWLCCPFSFWSSRVHSSILGKHPPSSIAYILSRCYLCKTQTLVVRSPSIGWTKTEGRSGRIPTKQSLICPYRCCNTVDGLDWFQRWRSFCRKCGFLPCCAQHSHLCTNKSPCMDMLGCDHVQEALSDRSHTGNDNRTCLYHSWCR